jgi:hypothetical protein
MEPSHSLGKEEILPRVVAREIVEPETCSSSNSKFLTLFCCPQVFVLTRKRSSS